MSYKFENERDLIDRGIALWTEELPELNTSGKAVTGRILRLAEIVSARMNEVAGRHAVKYGTYAILATLRAYGEPYAMTPSALHATLIVTSGGLSNQFAKLEKQGLIERRTDPSDGRGVLVQLTEAGLNLANAAMPDQARAECDLIRGLSTEERDMLESLLRKLLLLNSMGRS